MATTATIEARATLDDSDYRRKLQAMPGMAKSTLGNIGGFAMGNVLGNLIMKGVSGAIGFMKSSLQKFAVQDDAFQGLRASLRNLGKEYNLRSQDLAKFASELQKTTRYGDESTLQAMTQGLNMGISTRKIKDATKAAMGLAAAYKMDLSTAMMLVSRASQGNTGMLQRYGIAIDTSKTKKQQFNELLKKGADNFALAEDSAKTFSGQLTQASNAFGDLQESLGKCIVELFNMDQAGGSLADMLSDLTDYIRKNSDEWVLNIRKTYFYLEAGVKAIWELVKPIVEGIVDIFKVAMNNIIAIWDWGFDNVGKLWEKLPQIFIAIFKDICNIMKNYFKLWLDSFTTLGKAIRQALKGGGTAGFREMFNKLKMDVITLVSELGSHTEEAMRKAGVSELKLESPDYSKFIRGYKGLGDRLEALDRQRQEKQAKEDERYRKKLEEKEMAMQDKSRKRSKAPEEQKQTVMGSFSAAILDAMLGASTPEKETAKNTRKSVDLLTQIRNSGWKDNTYT